MKIKSVKSDKVAVRDKKRRVKQRFNAELSFGALCATMDDMRDEIRDLGHEVDVLRLNIAKVEELMGSQLSDAGKFLARLSHVEKIAKDAADKASEVEDRQMYPASSTKDNDLPRWPGDYVIAGSTPKAYRSLYSLIKGEGVDGYLKGVKDKSESNTGTLQRLLLRASQWVSPSTRHDTKGTHKD